MASERAVSNGCVGRFAVVKLWPGIRTAEDENIARLKIAARNLDLECIEILADGRFVDRPRTTITPSDADFVLHLHYDVPKQYDAFSFVALWNPVRFYHEWGYARCSRNLLTHDDFVSCGSLAADDHVARMIRKSGNHLPPKFTLYHSVDNTMYSPGLGNGTLSYTGINWEALAGGRSRHQDLLKELDRTGLLRIYGPKIFQGMKVWDGYRGYVGELAFDGRSVVDANAKAGAVLVLSSAAHKASSLMSSRLFEGLAAGALIICDENEFAKSNFGDSLLYVDMRLPAAEVCETILNHLSWAHSNSDAAKTMIARAQRIFESKFTLNRCLRDLYCGLQERKAELAVRQNPSVSPALHVAMVLLMPVYTEGILEKHVNGVLAQDYANVSAVLLIDRRARVEDIAKIHATVLERKAEIEVRMIEFSLYAGDGSVLANRPLGPIFAEAMWQARNADAIVFVGPNEAIISNHLGVLAGALRRDPGRAYAAVAVVINSRGRETKEVYDEIDLWSYDKNSEVGFARFMFRVSAFPADLHVALRYSDRLVMAALAGSAKIECERLATVTIELGQGLSPWHQQYDEEMAVIRDYYPDVRLPQKVRCEGRTIVHLDIAGRLLGFVANAFAMPVNTWLSIGGLAGCLLIEGWAAAEDWGRWGVGTRHVIALPPEVPSEGDLLLRADTRSCLVPQAPTMSVEIVVGDTKLGTWIFDFAESRGERWVVIPRKLISHGNVTEIEFHVKDPRSPMKLGQSADDRCLGLGLERVRFMPTSVQWDSAATEQRRAFPVVIERIAERYADCLDETWIDFEGRSPASPLLFRGWSSAEHWGKWGIGDSHTLVLPLRKGKGPGCELVAEVNAFFGPNSKEQTVGIFVRQRQIGTWIIKRSGWREQMMRIPVDLVRDDLLTEIEFRIADPRCPARLGFGADPRHLGLAIKRVKARPIDTRATWPKFARQVRKMTWSKSKASQATRHEAR